MKSIRELFAMVDQWKFASWTARSNAVMAIILAECVRDQKCDYAPLVVISGGDEVSRHQLSLMITRCDSVEAERPQSAQEVVEALRGWVDNEAQFISWDLWSPGLLSLAIRDLDFAMTGRVGKPLMVVVTGEEPVRLPANFRPSVLRIELV